MKLSDLNPPAFGEPWQAQLFALTVALNEAGHLPWTDWSQAFGARRVGGVEDASDYWLHWARTLADEVSRRNIAGAEEIAALALAWQRAAHATPHGQAVTLQNDPMA